VTEVSVIDWLGAIASFLWPGATSARFGGCSTGLVRFQFGVNGRDEEDASAIGKAGGKGYVAGRECLEHRAARSGRL
jgi:hypothetical protein